MNPWFISEDITIVEGIDWTWTDLYDPDNVPVDLSGYTSAWKLRINYSDIAAVLSLSTGGSGVVLASDGSVATSISATQASALIASIPGLSAFYAQTLTSGAGKVIPFKTGAVTIVRNVAR